jgi:predicted dehydrogenase
MKTYRVAILGCRARGEAAARAYHAHPRTQPVGLCDVVRERMDALGDALGVSQAARFPDLDEMIERTQPDIVAIPVGTEFHYPLLKRVLAHGVNVEVEKPICTSLDQADEVLALAQQKGARVAVHHQRRVDPPMRAAWQAYQEGKIGQLRYLQGSDKGYYGGYGLMNIGTHVINNMLKFGVRCHSVTAVALTGGRPITPDDVVQAAQGMGIVAGDHITATLQFEGNVTGTMLLHRFPKVDNTANGMELYGTEGRLIWRVYGAWHLSQPHFVPDGTHDRWQALPVEYPPRFGPRGAGDADEAAGKADVDDYCFVDEYVRALDEGRDHECNGEEGRHVLEILMGILESAAYGRRVELPQVQRDHPLLRWRREHGLGDPEPAPRPYKEWLEAEEARIARRVGAHNGAAASPSRTNGALQPAGAAR